MAEKGSWKKQEVGKSDMKLERIKSENWRRSWKVLLKLESTTEVGKVNRSWKIQSNLKR